MYINKKNSLFILILLGMVIILPKSAVIAQENSDLQALVKGNNAFALDLYAQLKTQEGNLFLSPYSISTALAMTFSGARGTTEKQMADVLHFTLEQEQLHSEFHDLQIQLKNYVKEGIELNIANALWFQTGYNLLKDFLELTEEHYDAGLNHVDFAKDCEAARRKINIWVEQKTNDKIQKLIKPGIINDLTCLVLTNAIYFKGEWVNQFEEELTQENPFYITPEITVDVPMMNQEDRFKYFESDELQVLEVPYKGDDLSMVILLPIKKDGLTELEDSVNTDRLQEWMNALAWRQVTVFFPKFTMTCEFRLGSALADMGMPIAFTGDADFSGMTGGTDLFIKKVVHKAFGDVSEEGTEAAAATGVLMEGLTSVVEPTPPTVFRADRPFIFVIRDNHSGSVLFIGRLVDPSK
ncbi:MAG: serpin family protein [bacterium]